MRSSVRVIAKRLRQQDREAFAWPADRHPESQKLTSREAEVLQLVAEGFANKQIAAELSISIKTVEKHRQQAMNKLNIHDVAGLTRYAISKGWVERARRLRLDPELRRRRVLIRKAGKPAGRG